MVSRDYFDRFPKLENESNAEYSRRIAKMMQSDGFTVNPESARVMYQRWIKVSRKLDKNGNEVSSVERFQVDAPDIPEGFIPTKITKTQSNQHWITYSKNEQGLQITKELIAETVKDLQIEPVKIRNQNEKTNKILCLTYTDVHIGMETDSDNTAMYPIEWNSKTVSEVVDKMVDKVHEYFYNHEAIHIRDLGDFLDGYNGETTRGGHKLPQNMSNAEAFKVGAKFKIKLAKALSQFGVPLYFHNVVNDNHSGDFAELLNYHVREVVSYMLPDSEYYIQRKFIEHYNYGIHNFVLSHGKDKKYCKAGLNCRLDKRTSDMIESYFNKKNLSGVITFEKGDSHVFINDKSKHYNFISHGALSPPSEWVQTNFTGSRQMFSIMEVKKDDKNVNIINFEI
jgi:nucleoid DNA-binding protein